ncbi:MAG: hypothetical protein KDG55_06460 [Rhodocyclaceae bacterium]|nr:hypothetical protein [Rhodocyclaceae bacterium]
MPAPVPVHPPHAAQTCAVCDRSLSFAECRHAGPAAVPLCASQECHWVAAQQARLGPFAYASFVRRHRESLARRQAEEARREARHLAQVAFESRESRRLLARVRAEAPSLPEPRPINLPDGRRPEEAVSQARIDRYRAHVLAQIDIARRADSSEDSDFIGDRGTLQREHETAARFAHAPALAGCCDALCRLCEGGCCTGGADHAHLGPLSFRLQLDAEPELSDEALWDRYRVHIPEKSRSGSCIHHTAQGCSLARPLRSPTCNAFYCLELRALQACEDPVGPVLAIQRNYGHFQRFDPGPRPRVVRLALIESGEARWIATRRPRER